MDPTITSKHLITSALQQLASVSNATSTTTADDQANPGTTTSTPQHTSRFSSKPTNPLTSLPSTSAPAAKSALLTLHFLFPFDFLPALDLIDRQLLQKLIVRRPSHEPGADAESPSASPNQPTNQATSISTFYIQSASAQSSTAANRAGTGTGTKGSGRFGNRNYAATRVHYEVHLDSWNCSCPAFAAANLRLILGSGSASSAVASVQDQRQSESAKRKDEEVGDDLSGDMNRVLIGGTATKDDALVPVCKHIVAAALCDTAPDLFGGGINVREVSVGEMAAWAAGWGET